MEIDAKWWREDGGAAVCGLCPHHCRIGPGQTGLCKVRRNDGNSLKAMTFGKVSSLALDPVEKKPLYHWHPGRQILSVGGVGCSMNCPFCQNWEIARWDKSVETIDLPPEKLAHTASSKGIDLVAFTYNEPLVSWEFLEQSMALLKERGAETALVTNGLICKEPLSQILHLIDAANVDVKTFSEDKYRQIGGDLDTVKNTVEAMAEAGVHVEISCLIVPGISDGLRQFTDMTGWISSVDPGIPLHVNRYYPAYRWTASATDLSLLGRLTEAASKDLDRVYCGNAGVTSITSCLSCGEPLVVRRGYEVDRSGLTDDGKCANCGSVSDIIP